MLSKSASTEFVDYDELMKDETELNNLFVLKYIKDMNNLFKPKMIQLNENLIPPPSIKDSNHFYFYICAYKYNSNRVKDKNQDSTILGRLISSKTKSIYTHISVSLDKQFESVLGLRINGLFREHPDYFRGYEARNISGGEKYPYDVYRYRLSKDEYRRGVSLFNKMILNQNKYKYETVGLISCLFDHLSFDGIPYSKHNIVNKQKDLNEKNTFICSSFGLMMLMNCLSDDTDKALNRLFGISNTNYILERINPGALIKINGIELMFQVDNKSDIKKSVINYETKYGVLPN